MSELTATQREDLKHRLLGLLSELERLIASAMSDTRPVDLDLPIGRLTRVDALQMQSMAKANKRQLEVRLQQVRLALGAVDDGSYGSCRRCGEAIGLARLDARPESPFCIGCQERAETRR